MHLCSTLLSYRKVNEILELNGSASYQTGSTTGGSTGMVNHREQQSYAKVGTPTKMMSPRLITAGEAGSRERSNSSSTFTCHVRKRQELVCTKREPRRAIHVADVSALFFVQEWVESQDSWLVWEDRVGREAFCPPILCSIDTICCP